MPTLFHTTVRKYLQTTGLRDLPAPPMPKTEVKRHSRFYPDYERFKEFYFRRLVNFVHDCIAWAPGERPTRYQDELFEQFPLIYRLTVRGPHGLGKTFVAAMVILWFSLSRDGLDWKALTTAGSWRQLYVYLWPEVHKWARLIRWDVVGRPPFNRDELLQTKLQLTTGAATAVASNKPELLEGAHADQLLYLFDESKAIGADTFDAAEGAFSGGQGAVEEIEPQPPVNERLAAQVELATARIKREAFALAISTPGEPIGRFYDMHARKPGYEDWTVRHVTLEEAMRAGRITKQWAEQRKAMWGESSAIYQNKVKGEFCVQEESGVIPLAWIEEAFERHDEVTKAIADGDCMEEPLSLLCADIAYGGNNQTALARFHGPDYLKMIETSPHKDTMATVGKIMGILFGALGINPDRFERLTEQERRKALRRIQVVIDVIGVGAGVFDRCREQCVNVEAFNAAEKTEFTDRSEELHFANVRAAAWWNLREELDPAYFPTLCLPRDDRLLTELKLPKWKQNSRGDIVVESKDDIARRLNQLNKKSKSEDQSTSTDYADTVVMARFFMRSDAPMQLVAPVSFERVSPWR